MRNRSQGCQPFPLVVLGFIDLKRYLCLLVTGAGGTAPNAAAHPFNAQGSAVLALSLQPADVPEVKLCVISIKATSPLWVRTSLSLIAVTLGLSHSTSPPVTRVLISHPISPQQPGKKEQRGKFGRLEKG